MATNPSNPFTQFYGQLLHQGNMLADHVRTSTYQQAMFSNPTDFNGKVVLDVGTGSGILSFFAIQSGAAKVYAVDASDSVEVARKISKLNGFEDKIVIIKGKIEEIELPEKVDVIVSEPIGFLLVHERMLESYVVARDRFLKDDGLMMPTTGSIVLTPFSDDAIYNDQSQRAQFWQSSNFYGVDISCVLDQAYSEYFSQPIVGTIPVASLISAHRTVHTIDFLEVSAEELQNFEIPFSFVISRTAILHGLAGWFDIQFLGSDAHVTLSTAPEKPTTHWYQCRLLLRDPLAVNRGQSVSGKLKFVANEHYSYTIDMTMQLDGTDIATYNRIHLKDQQYNYLNPTV